MLLVLLACTTPFAGFDRVMSMFDTGDSAADSAPTTDSAGSGLGAALPDAGSGNGVVRFVAFGDWGNGTSAQLAVANGMADVCATSGCDFAVLVGDNFYPSGVLDTADAYWTSRFEDVYTMEMPFYAVLGNHDWGSSGGGYTESLAQAQIDYSALSSRWVMPDFTWTLDVDGLVSFVALDTTTIFKGYGADQEAWIDAAITERPNPWRIVIGHHPYISNGIHGNAGEYDGVSGRGDNLKTFFEDHICGAAEVYLSGHDHTLQWPVSPCSTELIVSGGGGGFTSLGGTNATWFEAASAGFVWFEADSTTLTAVFYDEDGVELFRDTRARP